MKAKIIQDLLDKSQKKINNSMTQYISNPKCNFIRNRITELRLKKGVSEYQMSYDLGHSRGYVYNISSGKALPPLKEFFAICDYFGITPMEFFDTKSSNPKLTKNVLYALEQLDEDDLELTLTNIKRLLRK